MKCISLWQPWASVLFRRDPMCGAPMKVDETRHWATNVRGRVAIHAAKVQPDWEMRREYSVLLRRAGLEWGRLPYGKIVGTLKLIDCKPTTDIDQDRHPWQLAWGDYSAGRYAWVFSDMGRRILECPIPWKGKQGWFEIPDDLIIGEAR